MNCLYCEKELIGTQTRFCCKAHGSNWRNKNIYGYKWQKDYRGKTVRNYLSQLRSYYNRRETLSLDFLEELFNEQGGKCAISGVEMTHTQDGGKNPFNISIDRKDSSIGYTPENVWLVCYKVNIMKQEGTLEELYYWSKKIFDNQQADRPAIEHGRR